MGDKTCWRTEYSRLETIAAAQEVFEEMGPGHSEYVYETALDVELQLRTIPHRRQVHCMLKYKDQPVGTGLIDILVDDLLIVEVKSISKLAGKDEQQVKKYLTATGLDTALLINFGTDLEITEVRSFSTLLSNGRIEVGFSVVPNIQKGNNGTTEGIEERS